MKSKQDLMMHQKASARETDDQNTTLTDDLSDYSSSAHDVAAHSSRSRHQSSQ